MSDDRSKSTVDLASNLTVAWLGNPNVRASAEDAIGFLQNIHATLQSMTDGKSSASSGESAASEESGDHYEPAVTVRKSLASRDHLVSLIDGKPYTALKRHLSAHGLTPAQYRERYHLKPDYPMVAPAYSEKRRELARKIGLGKKVSRPRRRKSPSK